MNTPSSWLAPSPIHPSPFNRYMERLGESSQRTMLQALTTIAAILHQEPCVPDRFHWEQIRPDHIATIRSSLMEKYEPATVAKMLAALRGVFKSCRAMKLLSETDYHKNIQICHTQTVPQASSYVINQANIDALFKACYENDDNAGRRDAALLAIFLTAGLRRSEATSLNRADYDADTGKLQVGGKSETKHRQIELPSSARKILKRWLDRRGNRAGPLLMPVNRGDMIVPRRLTDEGINDILHRIASRAGQPGITGRDLRRAYAVSLIRSKKTPEEVKTLTGHASWLSNSTYESLATATDQPGYDIENLPIPSQPAQKSDHEDTAAGMVEIERKFLVTGEFKHMAKRSMRITQGYLGRDPQRTVRIRIQNDRGYITIKGASDASGTTRFEWQREIPLDEAKSLLALALPGVIDKTRHEIPAGDHTFEVDEFHGEQEGLILAEIELKSADELFVRPHWLGEEVTGDERYYNSALSKGFIQAIQANRQLNRRTS